MTEPTERRYVDGVPREVQDLLYAGKRIAAIKLVREKTGLGLKEAKDKVDRLSADIEAQFPGALPRSQGGPGCATVLAAVAIMVVVVVVLARRMCG